MTEVSHGAAFLGVERSLGERRWEAVSVDERLAAAIAQRHGLPDLLGRLLAGRLIPIDDTERFLAPRLRDSLPDPHALLDVERSAQRLAAAIQANERIAIFADYDVDGATSAALLTRFLRAVGVGARIYVPDRIDEGYGPNPAAMRSLRAEGIDIVVTVDCGTTAHVALEAAGEAGLDVVVIDHHTAEPLLPRAHAVINPNRLDEPDNPCRQLAAVGVTFLFVVALNRALRGAGWYRGRPEPDLMQWLDLVALGTVADVMPLTGLNRVLVAQGLRVMAKRGNPGLAALADVSGLKEVPDSYQLGFALGPRVNAGGRVGKADLGARLLSTDDPGEAWTLAQQLDGHNRERRAIESEVAARAIEAAGDIADDVPLLLISGESWHPGVIGIVASRLVERYGRPVCVLGIADGVAKASGRSIPGVDLGTAVIAARQAGLLLAGGGHAMAAGFSVAAERIEELRAFLCERLERAAASGPPPSTVRRLVVEGAVTPGGANADLLRLLGRIGPFGAGNPEPRLVLPSVRVTHAAKAGENHVRFTVGDGAGSISGIAFRSFATPIGQALMARGGPPLHLAGHLRPDRWRGGETVQLVLDDIGVPTSS